MKRSIGWVACCGLLWPGVSIADPCEDRARPVWVTSPPRGYVYDYFAGSADSAASPQEAIQAAIRGSIADIGLKRMLTVTSTGTSLQSEQSVATTTSDGSGRSESRLVTRVSREVQVRGHSTVIRGLEMVEKRVELCGDASRAHVLLRVPKAVPVAAPTFGYWAVRSLVPGWAQFEKGHPGRGWTILIGELLAAPTAVITASLASTARADADISRTQADRDFYNDRADTLRNVALVSGGIAIGLYIYNIIDGVAASEWNVRE